MLVDGGIFCIELDVYANFIYDGAILKTFGEPAIMLSPKLSVLAIPTSLFSPFLFLFFYFDNGGNLERVCIYMVVVCFVRVF